MIVQVRSTLKSELNCDDQLNWMWSITKITQDNDVTNSTNVISVEYDIELSRPIEYCVVYDDDEKGQQRD